MKGDIFGVGNDIIEISRIRDSLSKYGEKILNRILTPREKEYCQSMQDPAVRFAGRFAAKEAIAKALGCGFGKKLHWHDIEILNNAQGQPEVSLTSDAKTRFGSPKILLSISHCRKFATAVALASFS